ncbi:MAG: D-glycerate dehydrogenase [Chloroflexota bacterium]|nr:MAG: D-glycerate dehydrogenase [Chloroflexota bacterium]
MGENLPFVIITHDLPSEWIASLENRCQKVTGRAGEPGFSPELLERLPEAEGLFTLLTDRVDESILTRAPKLRVVSNMAVGVDNIDLQTCTRHGIPVGNTPGVLTEGTADLTMAILLAAARRLPEASADAREGRWTTWSPTGWLGADLNGATLGIIGMGKIGRAVATRALGFGMRLIYTDVSPRPEVDAETGARFVTLANLLSQSDFVSVHVPLTPETRSLIDEAALKQMKKSAILVNAARGPIVDSQALYHALVEGQIAAAALDVTDPEPLPPTHPLYSLSNCLIVPHIGSATRGTRRRMAELACHNLLAGLDGLPLPHCVNLVVYTQKP